LPRLLEWSPRFILDVCQTKVWTPAAKLLLLLLTNYQLPITHYLLPKIMIPRKRLDIAWSDLFFGIKGCFWQQNREEILNRFKSTKFFDDNNIVCFSVRSGFDLLLQVLALPKGSEILVSAITIRDMTRIIEHHGLVPVPIDLDMQTLSVKTESLESAINENTKAILVAHMFGSRMPLEALLSFAKRHKLLVIEDCAQAYIGYQYKGHPESDVSMFSFGPIKTDTALGGGILRFKERTLLEKVKTRQSGYPIQNRWQFLKRLGKYVILNSLSNPILFGILAAGCRLFGTSHDNLISQALRGFAGSDFFVRIRQQPSYPLLALLERRLKQFDSASIEQRIAVAHTIIELMPNIRLLGEKANNHSYWVFPIQVEQPDNLMRHLWQKGFDATRGASSLYVVKPPAHRHQWRPIEAQETMEKVLYLPVYPGVSVRDLKRLAYIVTHF